MQKWEYRVLVRTQKNGEWEWAEPELKGKSGQVVLNEFGQQGWELVSVPAWNQLPGSSLSAFINVHYIFKRALGG